LAGKQSFKYTTTKPIKFEQQHCVLLAFGIDGSPEDRVTIGAV
jgi:hypothetical protein